MPHPPFQPENPPKLTAHARFPQRQAMAEERKAATSGHRPERLRYLDDVAAVFARSGVRAAQIKFAQLKEKGYKSVYGAFEIALQYGVVQDQGKVLDWLDQSFLHKETDCLQVKSAPELDCVRSTPRFHDLLRRMGLEP